MGARTNRVERTPEFGGDAGVAGVLEHAHPLAAAHLPADLAAELKVVAFVVDGPAAIGLHVDAGLGVGDQLLGGERLGAGQDADVRHADERDAIPGLGPHAAAGTLPADRARRLAAADIADELTAADDIEALRRHPL